MSLNIEEGEIISIIGKNGSGKSTFLNLISGIFKPTKGEILIDGINTKSKKDFLKLRKKISIVFQNPDNQILFPRVCDDVEFAVKNLKLDSSKNKVEEALKKVNMYEFMENDTYELSLGQKQRVNLASSLAINPKYLILDEPTTMIDSIEKENVYDIIRELKKEKITIIFVTNNINEILLSDKIYVLQDKNIKYSFDKNDILENADILEKSGIRVPDIIQIILALRKNGIYIENPKDWTINEMISEIIKICKK